MEQLKQKAVKSVFWVGSTKALGQIISLASSVIVMRILSPADYGLMGMALVYYGILYIVYDLGMGLAVLQKANLTDQECQSAFWFTTMVGLLLYGLSWGLAFLCAAFFENKDVVPLIRVMSLGIVFLSIQEIPYSLMAKKFEFKKRGLAELASGIVGVGSCLGLALMGYGVWSLILSQVFKDLSLCILVLIFSKWRFQLYFDFSHVRHLMRYGLSVTGQSILEYLNHSSDSVIIGRFLGQNALGYYQVALSLAKMPIQRVIAITNKVAFPVFAELQNDNEKFKQYFYRLVEMISLFACPVFLGLFLISEDIIVLVLSEKWLPSLLILRLFCIWAIFRSYTGFFLLILRTKGNVDAAFRYSLYSAIILPVSFLVGVQFGITGVAFSWLICFPFLTLYLIYLVKKEINSSYIKTFQSGQHALAASVLMVVSGFLLKSFFFSGMGISFFTMGMSILFGILVFSGYFLIFSRKTYTQIRSLMGDLTS